MKTLIILLMSLIINSAFAATASRNLASIRQSLRVEHARELMGPCYGKSIVSRFENRKGMEKNIHRIVEARLPKKDKHHAQEIAKTIIHEASAHGLDPYFVMAVISGESSFNPTAVGPVGEIGLMQIRMSTGKWLATLFKQPWKGSKTLQDPIANIKLGVAYLSWLRAKFEGHGQLYLAAYNMGPKSVKSAVSRKIYPKDYPLHVMKRYLAFYKDMNKQNVL
jgi:soluble lytic murein transglycosylase